MTLTLKRKREIKKRIEEMKKWQTLLDKIRWEALRRGDFKGSIRLFRQIKKLEREISWYQRKLK
jgi:hypothetical protein